MVLNTQLLAIKAARAHLREYQVVYERLAYNLADAMDLSGIHEGIKQAVNNKVFEGLNHDWHTSEITSGIRDFKTLEEAFETHARNRINLTIQEVAPYVKVNF